MGDQNGYYSCNQSPDIEHGKPQDLYACPVALALKAHFGTEEVYADCSILEVVTGMSLPSG